MVPFTQVISGDTIMVPKKWVISCCDCGLVHTLRIRAIKNKPEYFLVNVVLNPTLTKKRRRDKREKLIMMPK